MPVRTPGAESDSQELQKIRKPRRQRRNTTSTISTTTHLGETGPKMSEHQCCGVVEEAAFQVREKRANRTKPQPWIARKLMIGICLGIMGYSAYVYIGRFCVGAIKKTPESVTGRPAGIVLLVFFCILYLWMIWAYIKVIVTPPGFATDHIPQTPAPLMEEVPDPPSRGRDIDLERTLSPYEQPFDNSKSAPEFDPTRTHRGHKPSYSSTSSHMNRPYPPDPIAGPSYEDIVLRESSHSRSKSLDRASQPTKGTEMRGVGGTAADSSDEDGGVGQGRLRTPFDPPFSTLVLPKQRSPRQEMAPEGARPDGRSVRLGSRNEIEPSCKVPDRSAQVVVQPPPVPSTKATPSKPWTARSPWRLLFLPGLLCHRDPNPGPQRNEELRVRRRPSTTPTLHPAYRYCHRDGLLKPYRTHHCRNCGTCVLKFDHHCPWIGQCVGARNHKFFLNFCQAAGVFTLYVLGTLVGFNVRAWVSHSSLTPLDPQIIVVSALAALFTLFTNVLVSSHVLLIVKGQTTVESMINHSTKERESAALRKEYGLFAWRAVRETRRRWNEEWGDLDTEGNLWWTGSRKQGWIDVMGTNPLGWILPIGRSLSDGLSYPVNPRFDEHGRLRRRADWPAELR